jgi:TP901 family phage tail tape measure protein
MAQAKLELLLELKNKLKAGLASAKDNVLREMKGLKEKLGGFSPDMMEGIRGLKDELPGVGRALGLLANPYALAAAAALSFGAATAQSVNMALDWEKTMAKVNVTAQLGRRDLGNLSDKILEIGGRSSGELQQVPEAFNRIISAGLDVNQSLTALEPTLKAAKAGFTDIETVAAAGIGVMKSSGENINKVYDTLFATLNKGNVEFKDIAQYLPKIIPGAKNAGFSLSEVGGAFAFLTAQGQTAEATTTGLMNTFKAFSKPETIKGFKSIGVDIFDANRNTKPFLQIMTELSAVLATSKNKESFIRKFSEIGLDQDAVAAVSSMIQNMNELKSTIDFTTNSQGQLNLAVKNARTSTDDWAEGWNNLKVRTIEYGQAFLPMIEKMGTLFKELNARVDTGDVITNNFKTQREEFEKTRTSLQGLIGEYKSLSSFTILSDSQKNDLQSIKNKIAEIVPQAASYDSKGNAASLKLGQIAGFINTYKSGVEELKNDAINQYEREIRSISDRIQSATANLRMSTSSADITKYRGELADLNAKLGSSKSGLSDLKFGSLNLTGSAKSGTPVSSAVASASPGGGNGATSAATQSKSIIVNIAAFQKIDTQVLSAQDKQSLTDLERQMNEIFLRTIRNVEASY